MWILSGKDDSIFNLNLGQTVFYNLRRGQVQNQDRKLLTCELSIRLNDGRTVVLKAFGPDDSKKCIIAFITIMANIGDTRCWGFNRQGALLPLSELEPIKYEEIGTIGYTHIPKRFMDTKPLEDKGG